MHLLRHHATACSLSPSTDPFAHDSTHTHTQTHTYTHTHTHVLRWSARAGGAAYLHCVIVVVIGGGLALVLGIDCERKLGRMQQLVLGARLVNLKLLLLEERREAVVGEEMYSKKFLSRSTCLFEGYRCHPVLALSLSTNAGGPRPVADSKPLFDRAHSHTCAYNRWPPE